MDSETQLQVDGTLSFGQKLWVNWLMQWRVLAVLLSVELLLLLLSMVIRNTSITDLFLWWLLFLWGLLFLGVFFVYFPLMSWRLNGTYCAIISPDELKVQFLSKVQCEMPWIYVKRIRRRAGLIIMSFDWSPMVNRLSSCYIPESAFASKEAADKFYQTATGYWQEGQAKKHELGICGRDLTTRSLKSDQIAVTEQTDN